jgi:hypothetical protein
MLSSKVIENSTAIQLLKIHEIDVLKLPTRVRLVMRSATASGEPIAVPLP